MKEYLSYLRHENKAAKTCVCWCVTLLLMSLDSWNGANWHWCVCYGSGSHNWCVCYGSGSHNWYKSWQLVRLHRLLLISYAVTITMVSISTFHPYRTTHLFLIPSNTCLVPRLSPQKWREERDILLNSNHAYSKAFPLSSLWTAGNYLASHNCYCMNSCELTQ